MLRITVAAILLGACSAAPATAKAPAAAGAKPGSADDAFTRLVDDYFEANNRYSPTGAVGNGFHAPSEVRPRIEPTPPYARGTGFASMDTPGPFETRATEAFYYVEPVEPEWDAGHKDEHLRLFNPPVVGMINVHEAFPGHYVQFLYSPRSPTKTRKLIAAGSNAEGWAHYSEQMMVDQGFGGGDPKIRLAQLSEALLRDCRYVVGVKLHTRNMTVADGAKLFTEQCFQQPSAGYVEARRGTFNPTYLYYTLGKLEIQELAADYMREKGATLKQFHDAFIAQGALPIPLVRRILLTRR